MSNDASLCRTDEYYFLLPILYANILLPSIDTHVNKGYFLRYLTIAIHPNHALLSVDIVNFLPPRPHIDDGQWRIGCHLDDVAGTQGFGVDVVDVVGMEDAWLSAVEDCLFARGIC